MVFLLARVLITVVIIRESEWWRQFPGVLLEGRAHCRSLHGTPGQVGFAPPGMTKERVVLNFGKPR
jgi:hypothetical protein